MERGTPGIGRGSIGAAPEGTASTAIVPEACASNTVAVADRTRQQRHTMLPGPAKPPYAPTPPLGGSAAHEKPRPRSGPSRRYHPAAPRSSAAQPTSLTRARLPRRLSAPPGDAPPRARSPPGGEKQGPPPPAPHDDDDTGEVAGEGL